MCLAIPGQIVRLLPGTDLATADVMGVKRSINVALLENDGIAAGDWVLIHVGFAMNKISESEAREQLTILAALGENEAAMEEVRGYGLHEPDGKPGP
jgi:hydrogenase expression/formation protein HypC